MLIVAGIPDHPAKFMVRGKQSNQQTTIGRPMETIEQRAWLEIVLKPMDKVILANAQIRHKLSTFEIPTKFAEEGLP
jgi:hypothetical protein